MSEFFRILGCQTIGKSFLFWILITYANNIISEIFLMTVTSQIDEKITTRWLDLEKINWVL